MIAKGGRRVPLDGYCDGHERMRLGYLIVRDGGKSLSVRPVEDLPPRSAWQKLHVNEQPRVIDFGPVATDGSISLQRVSDRWQLRSLPREGKFTIWFDGRTVRKPATVTAEMPDGSTRPAEIRTDGQRWGVELNGARLYAWPADPKR
jgi:hypothetical protein